MASQFVFHTTRNIMCELGCSRTKLGGLVKNTGARRAMVVTDAGIRRLGLLEQPIQSLEKAGVSVEVFDAVEADPSERVIFACTEAAKAAQADVLIGLGGGSSMDTAKLCAILAHPNNTQPLSEMYGVGNITPGSQRLGLVQVPTTAGTGSEVTNNSIITTGKAEKKGLVDPLMLPDWAVLDGELTLSVPKHVTSATGVDAMVHAIEAYTSKFKKNMLSDDLARRALTLLGQNIKPVCNTPDNGEARSAMLLGACLAGIAFNNAPVAAVHALAYPIGSHFKVPHGLSNSLVLPHVMKFNAQSCGPLYAEIAELCLPHETFRGDAGKVAMDLAGGYLRLGEELEMKTTLREVNIAEADVELLATESMKQTRLLPNNPREVLLDDAREIYSAAF